MHNIIPKLFDCWADTVAHLLLLKSSMDHAMSQKWQDSKIAREWNLQNGRFIEVYLCNNSINRHSKNIHLVLS